ncbi:hypothetical protein GDN83_06525 [Gordonia jinghuaiqii]|nr:hypothetical protein [Gordonia jinghuaiqii]
MSAISAGHATSPRPGPVVRTWGRWFPIGVGGHRSSETPGRQNARTPERLDARTPGRQNARTQNARTQNARTQNARATERPESSGSRRSAGATGEDVIGSGVGVPASECHERAGGFGA